MNISVRPSRWGIRKHSRAFLSVGVVSSIGILGTIGFQILTGRFLGPEAYGLLASFMAIVSIAATGSSALQNSVAVGAAKAKTLPFGLRAIKSRDNSLTEALVLGLSLTLAIFLASPFLASLLKTGIEPVFLAGCTVIPAFLFSRALGILQGNGSSFAVSGWTSFGQMIRLALAAVVISLSLGAVSLLVTVLLATIIVTVGASVQAKKTNLHPAGALFSMESLVVILLIISFAWLTNIEVVLVRGGTSELVSGSFAAAAVMTKMILIAPSMMSVYLLPKFVTNVEDSRNTKVGVNVSLGMIAALGIMAFAVLLISAEPITHLLFGNQYSLAAQILPWLSLAYLPWALTQTLLIRLTAISSRWGLVILLLAIVFQWVVAMILLPDIWAMIGFIGILGLAVFLGLFVVHIRGLRKHR